MRKYRVIKYDGYWYAQKRILFFFWRSISHTLSATIFAGTLKYADVNSRVFKHILGRDPFRLHTRFDAQQRVNAYIQSHESGRADLPTILR